MANTINKKDFQKAVNNFRKENGYKGEHVKGYYTYQQEAKGTFTIWCRNAEIANEVAEALQFEGTTLAGIEAPYSDSTERRVRYYITETHERLQEEANKKAIAKAEAKDIQEREEAEKKAHNAKVTERLNVAREEWYKCADKMKEIEKTQGIEKAREYFNGEYAEKRDKLDAIRKEYIR